MQASGSFGFKRTPQRFALNKGVLLKRKQVDLKEKSSEEEILAKLRIAVNQKEGVIVIYRPYRRDREHAFLLFPRSIFERRGYTYVEGWSAHQPTSIVLWRGPFRPSGKRRLFRVDRMVAVEPRKPAHSSITGYVLAKIQRRGIVPGLWGLFLDLLLMVFFVLLALKLISLLFQ